jgi:hypothetical protein
VVKTLGRCVRRHAQVVEYVDDTLPSGVCKYVPKDRDASKVTVPCGEPLVEWALKSAPNKADK